MSFTFPNMPQAVTPDEIGSIVNREIDDLLMQWNNLHGAGQMPSFVHEYRNLEETSSKSIIEHSFRSAGAEFGVSVEFEETPQAQVDRLWISRTPAHTRDEAVDKVFNSYSADMMDYVDRGKPIIRKKAWFADRFHQTLQDMLNDFGDFKAPKPAAAQHDPDESQAVDPPEPQITEEAEEPASEDAGTSE